MQTYADQQYVEAQADHRLFKRRVSGRLGLFNLGPAPSVARQNALNARYRVHRADFVDEMSDNRANIGSPTTSRNELLHWFLKQ